MATQRRIKLAPTSCYRQDLTQNGSLNTRDKTIRLRGKRDVNFHDLGLGSGFLDITPKAQVVNIIWT